MRPYTVVPAQNTSYLRLVLPLFINPLPCLLSFFRTLDLGGYGADFDSLHRTDETTVEGKRVLVVDVSARRMLFQDFVLGTGERL